jgi:hypothetical protein
VSVNPLNPFVVFWIMGFVSVVYTTASPEDTIHASQK